MKYNTRIAPSPTGDMHIGTARTAYFNWLAARASGGEFILRIDDTDAARSKQEYVAVIKETMNWLALDCDREVFQSSRKLVYNNFIIKILKYIKIEGAAVLLDLRDAVDLPKSWEDSIAGTIPITQNDLDGMQFMPLMKSDGMPTYNWASVVDDADLGINYIIRGSDHITNTAKQVVLWHLMGLPTPKFSHIGLIGLQGKPLSKREGAASMLYYREKGYDADAMLNFLARLGWGPKVDDRTTKTLPRERMLEIFLDQGNLRSSLANLDFDKLESYDRKYKAQKKIWRNGGKLS